VREHAHLGYLVLQLWALDVLRLTDEEHGDGVQGLLGPREHPINSTAVHERREHPYPLPERFSHRRQAEHDVQVVSHFLYEVLVEIHAKFVRLLNTFFLDELFVFSFPNSLDFS